jgi:hypothetical protein
MLIQVKQLRDADIIPEGDSVTIVLNEFDGSTYGSKTDIKIPAQSYELLEQAIVDRRLANKNSSIE